MMEATEAIRRTRAPAAIADFEVLEIDPDRFDLT